MNVIKVLPTLMLMMLVIPSELIAQRFYNGEEDGNSLLRIERGVLIHKSIIPTSQNNRRKVPKRLDLHVHQILNELFVNNHFSTGNIFANTGWRPNIYSNNKYILPGHDQFHNPVTGGNPGHDSHHNPAVGHELSHNTGTGGNPGHDSYHNPGPAATKQNVTLVSPHHYVSGSEYLLSSNGYNNKRKDNNNCATPSGAVGICTSLRSCQSLRGHRLSLHLQQTRQVVSRFICRYSTHGFEVCCPDNRETSTDSSIGSQSRYLSMSDGFQSRYPSIPDGSQSRYPSMYGNSDSKYPTISSGPQSKKTSIFSESHPMHPTISSGPQSKKPSIPSESHPMHPTISSGPQSKTPSISSESHPMHPTISSVANPIPTEGSSIGPPIIPPSLSEEQCGIPPFSTRVIGEPSEFGSWPWLAAIGTLDPDGSFTLMCGGSLITNHFVLTAFHCFLDPSSPTHVRLGEHDLLMDNDGAEDFRIVATTNFSYNEISLQNDIVLLKLDKEVEYNSFVSPICLPFDLIEESLEGKLVEVAGWGSFGIGSQDSSFSRVPRMATLPIVNLLQCMQNYSATNPRYVISESQFCAAGTSDMDTCDGDSGGPVVYLSPSGRYTLVGLVSFGPTSCGFPDLASVYTRVSSFLHEILTAIKS